MNEKLNICDANFQFNNRPILFIIYNILMMRRQVECQALHQYKPSLSIGIYFMLHLNTMLIHSSSLGKIFIILKLQPALRDGTKNRRLQQNISFAHLSLNILLYVTWIKRLSLLKLYSCFISLDYPIAVPWFIILQFSVSVMYWLCCIKMYLFFIIATIITFPMRAEAGVALLFKESLREY